MVALPVSISVPAPGFVKISSNVAAYAAGDDNNETTITAVKSIATIRLPCLIIPLRKYKHILSVSLYEMHISSKLTNFGAQNAYTSPLDTYILSHSMVKCQYVFLCSNQKNKPFFGKNAKNLYLQMQISRISP